MRPLLFILSFYFFSCKSNVKSEKHLPKEYKSNTLSFQIKYRGFKNGLYINSQGDIGIKSFEKSVKDTLLETYITRVYSDKTEADSGPQYLKNVIDTATFQALEDRYFKDSKNAYFQYSTSDGGALKVVKKAEPKSFKSVGKKRVSI